MKDFFEKIFIPAEYDGFDFISQHHDRARCGQVAIYNALIWLGRKPDMQHITRNTSYSPKWGTPIHGITDYLRRKRVDFSYRTRLKMRDIERNLELGHIIIYLYCPCAGNAHYTLLVEDHKKHLVSINFSSEEIENNLPVAVVEKSYYNKMSKKFALLNHKRHRVYPQGWIIRHRKSKTKT